MEDEIDQIDDQYKYESDSDSDDNINNHGQHMQCQQS